MWIAKLAIGSDARNVTPHCEQVSRNGWNLGTALTFSLSQETL
jgi:hypothetical protein